MREGSDLAHHIAGSVLALAAVLVLAGAIGLIDRIVWSALLGLFGVAFVLYLVFHHGLGNVSRNWRYLWGDAQQRQHLFLGVLVAVGAIAEAAGSAAFFALALAAAGALFIVHPQHGTDKAAREARRAHVWLGSLLVLAAIGRAFAITQASWLAAAWAIPLLLAALVLIRYREPAGAYENVSHRH